MSLGARLQATFRLACWTARAALPEVLAVAGGIVLLAAGLAGTFSSDPPALAAAEAMRASMGLGGVIGMFTTGVLGARILSGGRGGSARAAVLASPVGLLPAVAGTMAGLLALAMLLAIANVGAAYLAAGLAGGSRAAAPSALFPWRSQVLLDPSRGAVSLPPGGRQPLSLPPRDALASRVRLDLDLIPSLRATHPGQAGACPPALEIRDARGRVVDRVPLEDLARGGFARVEVALPEETAAVDLVRPAGNDPILLRARVDRTVAWLGSSSLTRQFLHAVPECAADLATMGLAGVVLAALLPSTAGAMIAVTGGAMIALLLPEAPARSLALTADRFGDREDLLAVGSRRAARALLGIAARAGALLPALRTPELAGFLAEGAAIPARRTRDDAGRLAGLALVALAATMLRLRGLPGPRDRGTRGRRG